MSKQYYNPALLKQIRETRYTQAEIARKLNYHVKTISRAETGRSASLSLLTDITNACGQSVKQVIYDFPLILNN